MHLNTYDASSSTGTQLLPPTSIQTVLSGAFYSGVPDGKTEGDLVDEICKVVDHVERRVVDFSHQKSEQIAERVDRPASSHDETHGGEGPLDVLVHFVAR